MYRLHSYIAAPSTHSQQTNPMTFQQHIIDYQRRSVDGGCKHTVMTSESPAHDKFQPQKKTIQYNKVQGVQVN